MNRCKVCNDEFEMPFGYDEEHCDPFCARVTDPSIEIAQLRALEPKPKRSLFTYYKEAFLARARGSKAVEVEERILQSKEYIRLRKRFEVDEHTMPELRKVKV